MEGSSGYIVQDQCLFFILGASDDLIDNLKKMAVRVSMRLSSSIEYLLNMPIGQFMEMVEDIIEEDQENRQRREEIRRRQNRKK